MPTNEANDSFPMMSLRMPTKQNVRFGDTKIVSFFCSQQHSPLNISNTLRNVTRTGLQLRPKSYEKVYSTYVCI